MTTQVDLIEFLEQDHRRIDGLAERLDSTDDAEELRDLYRQIVDALRAHESIENQILFPAYREMIAAEGGTSTLDERLGEHDEMNSLLAEMSELESDCFAFIKRGSALLLEIEGHFAREEESVFAPMRDRIPAEELLRLGEQAMTVKNATT